MVAVNFPARKSGRVTKASLVQENRLMRIYLESAIQIVMDTTNFVELGDPPDDPDAYVNVPFGLMETLRDAVKLYAQRIGFTPE